MINIEFPTIIVKGKEGLREILSKINYIPDDQIPMGQLAQTGAPGDIRAFIDLLEICTDSLTEVLMLRTASPNLLEKLSVNVNNLNKEKDRITENTNSILKREQ